MKEYTRLASLLLESSFDYITEKEFIKTLEELYYSAKGSLIIPILEGTDVSSVKKSALKLSEKAKRTDDEEVPLPKKYVKADTITPEGVYVFEGTDLNDLIDGLDESKDFTKLVSKFKKNLLISK